MLNKKYIVGIFFILFSIIIGSCTNKSICLEPQIVTMKSNFYFSNSDTSISLKDTFLTNANILFGNSNYYLENLKNTNYFAIPLSTTTDSTTLIFQSDSTNVISNNSDTIVVKYSNSLNFISVACGYQMVQNINSIYFSKNIIDTIYINNTVVNSNVNTQHLKIVITK